MSDKKYYREDRTGKYWEDRNGNREYEKSDKTGDYREDRNGNRTYHREDRTGKYWEDRNGNREYEKSDKTGDYREDRNGNRTYHREDRTGKYDETSGSSSSGGGCFLTTACVEYVGLPDDCHELETLRHFRDTYVRHLPEGSSLLAEYYSHAPKIVDSILVSPEKDELLKYIYDCIQVAVGHIDEGNLEDALKCYSNMYSSLSSKSNEV
jgi:hypothetical protein